MGYLVHMHCHAHPMQAAMELKGLQGSRWNVGTALPDPLWSAMLKELRDAGVNV
jgi:hypothetical protein